MDMAKPSRRSPRIRTWFETHFSSQRQEGEGILADISYTGARVEDSELRPKIGAQVILYVSLPEQDKPFQLEGKVARQTTRGFAIEYERPGPDVRRGVDRVAELVGELDNLAPSLASDANDADEPELPLENAVTQPRNVPIALASPRPKREEVSVERLEHKPAAPGPKLDASPLPAASKDAGKRETAPMARANAIDLSAMPLQELEALRERLDLEIGTRREEAKQRVRQEIEQLAQREGFSVEELIEPSQR
jgi:PilZ domain